MSVTYMTKQQRAVLACVESCGSSVSAAELAQQLHSRGEAIGLTTVYRQLEKLAQQGLVHKIVTDEGGRYQFCHCHLQGRDCFLLKCERCGAVEHADCAHLGELYAHLEAAHRFHINPRKTLFYGLCARCGEAAE